MKRRTWQRVAETPRKEVRDYLCEVCGRSACFGLQWPLSPAERWFCGPHKPADYFGDRHAA